MAMLRSCGERWITSTPSKRIAPEVGLSSPAIMFMGRGFAAPRRTKQDEQLAVRDRHVKSTNSGVLAIGLGDIIEVDAGHELSLPSRQMHLGNMPLDEKRDDERRDEAQQQACGELRGFRHLKRKPVIAAGRVTASEPVTRICA